jgi:hypothetical protein
MIHCGSGSVYSSGSVSNSVSDPVPDVSRLFLAQLIKCTKSCFYSMKHCFPKNGQSFLNLVFHFMLNPVPNQVPEPVQDPGLECIPVPVLLWQKVAVPVPVTQHYSAADPYPIVLIKSGFHFSTQCRSGCEPWFH